MKVPINCPVCNDPMNNVYNSGTTTVLYKDCRLRPDHIFTCVVYDADTPGEFVARVCFTLSMVPPLSIRFFFGSPYTSIMKKEATIDGSYPNRHGTLEGFQSELPFFEPDFSDYKKLVEKIKIYIAFS